MNEDLQSYYESSKNKKSPVKTPINHVSRIRRNIHEHLYARAKQSQKSKEKDVLNNVNLINSEAKRIHTLSETENIISKQRQESISKLFKILDRDNDGMITIINGGFQLLPLSLKKILFPVIEQLKSERQPLKEKEFCNVLENFLNEVSRDSQRELIQFTKTYIAQTRNSPKKEIIESQARQTTNLKYHLYKSKMGEVDRSSPNNLQTIIALFSKRQKNNV